MQPSTLIINEANKFNLLILAKWLKFFAILSFVLSGFMILMAIGIIIMGGSLPAFANFGAGASMGLYGVGILYLFIALLILYTAIRLYHSSKDMKLALLSNNQNSLDSGFKNLMQYYRFNGILTIILIGIYIFAIFFALGFAAYTKSSTEKFGVEYTEESGSDETAVDTLSAIDSAIR